MAQLPLMQSSSDLAYQLSDIALTPILTSTSTPTNRTPDHYHPAYNHSSSSSSSHSLSTTRSQQADPRNQALTCLTSAAASAFDTASRLGLGDPQRILIETQSHGPVVLHSFLNPRYENESRTRSLSGSMRIVDQVREELRPLSRSTEGVEELGRREAGFGSEVMINGFRKAGSDEEDDDNKDRAQGNLSTHIPPMLIVTVVAPSARDAGEARRIAAKLERVGGDFQREWVLEQSRGGEAGDTEAGEDEDG
ncbi:hypothetical protein BGZ60DRAFT_393154 [Tricladium varicosporioides]|nr:hypothetical protein BGZ60DRAFT_393154 [Hymenoscyphus varicosporioides]